MRYTAARSTYMPTFSRLNAVVTCPRNSMCASLEGYPI